MKHGVEADQRKLGEKLQKYCWIRQLNKEDVMDHSKWRKLI